MANSHKTKISIARLSDFAIHSRNIFNHMKRNPTLSEKELANQIKKTIVELKKTGATSIDCDQLIYHLDKIIDSDSKTITEIEMEGYRAQLQSMIGAEQHNYTASLEMFKSVIQSGQNALRASFLLNGGASIALLAFIGKLTESQHDKIASFAESLTLFVFGVLTITIASGATYLSQFFYAEENSCWQKIGHTFNFIAISLSITSYGCFMNGMHKSYIGFLSFSQ